MRKILIFVCGVTLLMGGTTVGQTTDASHTTQSGAERCKNVPLNKFIFSKIDDNIYNVGKFRALKTPAPKKNISWIVTDEGVVVIDTGNRQSAKIAKQKIRETTDKPIKYIIYTHHHGTQVSGTEFLKDPETKVIAHEDLVTEFDLSKKFYGYNARLNSIQFNFNPPASPKPRKRVYPDITFKTEYSFSLGGVKFNLYHVVGEAQDYTIIFLPDQKIVWVGDMVGAGMPMVASPMKRVRDEVKWRNGLKFIKNLKPEIIISSAFLPFCEQDLITKRVDPIIEYLDFLYESVAREMNAGSSLEETLNNIQLPEHMKSNPLLQERYGRLQFNIRGLYHRYSGWFSQNGTHLNPAPAKEKAENFIQDMGGGKKVLQRTRSLEKESNYKLALEYLDLLIAAGIQLKEAHKMKGSILIQMSTRYTHQITANMYRRLAKMEEKKAAQISKQNLAVPALTPD